MRHTYYDEPAADTRDSISRFAEIEPCPPCGSFCLDLWSNRSVRFVTGMIEWFSGNQFVIRCLLCNFAGPEAKSDIDAIEGWNQLPRVSEEVPDVPF